MSAIWREAVVGIMVSSCPYLRPPPGHPTHFTILRPLVVDWAMEVPCNDDVESKEETVGLLPVAGAYKVYGNCSCGEALELGFEFQGAYRPDWETVLVEKLSEHKHRQKAAG